MNNAAIPLVHDFLIKSADRLPDKVALVCQGQRLTYAELDTRSNALANALARRGVERGDRVVVFAENTIETVVSFWGILKANAVFSMVNHSTKADKLTYQINDCQAAALITAGNLTPVWTEAVEAAGAHLKTVIVAGMGMTDNKSLNCQPEIISWEEALVTEPEDTCPQRRCIDIDLGSLIYTSGSTGDPKGVMMTHRNMMTAATSIAEYLENTEDDVILGVLPLSHNYGLYQLICAFKVGARLILERNFSFPPQVLQRVVEEGVTGFPAVPTIYAMMAEMKTLRNYDFSKVRYLTNAAAALPVKHIEMIRAVFPTARLFSMYGQTECVRATYLPPEDLERKPTSIGIAPPNTELWVVDEQDRRIGPGDVGQLIIRGANVMRGYWGKPEATAQRLRPGPLPGETVLYTGDLVKMDEDGYLYFVSRMDDIIKCRGEKVSPKEVEAALMNIPGVKEAAVIGVPDDILGQAVKAFVALEEGLTLSEKDILRACQQRLEIYMVPKYIAFLDSLPKTTSGKIRKVELKEAETAAARDSCCTKRASAAS